MIELIMDDIKRHPEILFPFGKTEVVKLKRELEQYDFEFPQELINVWLEFGGGDFFQTETILYPFQNQNVENIVDANNFFYKKGMLDKYFAFHTGRGEITAFVKGSLKIVNLNSDNWQETYHYNSFTEWFKDLRGELIALRYSD